MGSSAKALGRTAQALRSASAPGRLLGDAASIILLLPSGHIWEPHISNTPANRCKLMVANPPRDALPMNLLHRATTGEHRVQLVLKMQRHPSTSSGNRRKMQGASSEEHSMCVGGAWSINTWWQATAKLPGDDGVVCVSWY